MSSRFERRPGPGRRAEEAVEQLARPPPTGSASSRTARARADAAAERRPNVRAMAHEQERARAGAAHERAPARRASPQSIHCRSSTTSTTGRRRASRSTMRSAHLVGAPAPDAGSRARNALPAAARRDARGWRERRPRARDRGRASFRPTLSRIASGASPLVDLEVLAMHLHARRCSPTARPKETPATSSTSQPSPGTRRANSRTQAGLADARLAHQGDDPAAARRSAVERVEKPRELGLAADDAAQRRARRGPPAASGSRAAPATSCTSTGSARPRTGIGPRGRVTTREPASAVVCRGGEDRGGLGHLLHARGEVHRLAHRGVGHVQVAPDRAHDHLARVQARRGSARAARLLALEGVAVRGHRAPACAGPRSRRAPRGPRGRAARRTAP